MWERQEFRDVGWPDPGQAVCEGCGDGGQNSWSTPSLLESHMLSTSPRCLLLYNSHDGQSHLWSALGTDETVPCSTGERPGRPQGETGLTMGLGRSSRTVRDWSRIFQTEDIYGVFMKTQRCERVWSKSWCGVAAVWVREWWGSGGHKTGNGWGANYWGALQDTPHGVYSGGL